MYGVTFDPGWDLIHPGFGGMSTLARGETLAARWLSEPQPIIGAMWT